MRKVATAGGGRSGVVDAARAAAVTRRTGQAAWAHLTQYMSCFLVWHDNLLRIAHVLWILGIVAVVLLLVVMWVLVIGK